MSVTVPNCTLDADQMASMEPRWVRPPFRRKGVAGVVDPLGGDATAARRTLKSTFKRQSTFL
jgi:hypothetical protein